MHSTFLSFCFAKIAHAGSGDISVIAKSGEKLPTEEQRACSARVNRYAMIKMFFAAELENPAYRSRAEPVAIWKARKYIEEHADEELSLTKVAKAVNMNANYLSENFKQVTGMNFVEYVARTRLANACHLLRKSNLRITEVAFAAGFQSLSQFNRVFKKFSGKSPTQYRESESVASSVHRTHAQFPFSVVRPIRIAKSPSAPQESQSKVTKSLPAVRKPRKNA